MSTSTEHEPPDTNLGILRRGQARIDAITKRVGEWADKHEPDSAPGVAIGAWRRYRGVDGPLQ